MTGSEPAEMHWIDESTFTVRDTTFVANPTDRFTPTADRFSVVKPPGLVRQYAGVIQDLKPKTIVELGIFSGGSTALLNEAADVKADRVEALDPHWALIRRGDKPIDRDTFSLGRCYNARSRSLVNGLVAPAPLAAATPPGRA